jgi:predicted DNA-binding transcriptional regulator YafY
MRASRLLAILILLQNRGLLTAASLADEFEVSVRTIYRDIDALSASGVPVYGDRGPGGGYALLDGYRTRLTGLADDEAAALALAGVPSAAEATGFGSALRDAFGKLFAALPGEGGKRAGEAAARFHIDPADWYRGAQAPDCLPDLARAVLSARRVQIRYASWTAESDWELDPLGLVLKADEWYLVGYGRGRIGTFRVNAVAELTQLDDKFEHPKGFDLAQWWQEAQANFEASLFTTSAQIRISQPGCDLLSRQSSRGRAAVALASLCADGWYLIELPVEASEHGLRELLWLGREIEVLAPASLRARMQDATTAIAHIYA